MRNEPFFPKRPELGAVEIADRVDPES